MRACWSGLRLLLVIALSAALQFEVTRAGLLGGLLRVPAIPPAHGLLLLAVALVPVTVLEGTKLARRWLRA